MSRGKGWPADTRCAFRSWGEGCWEGCGALERLGGIKAAAREVPVCQQGRGGGHDNGGRAAQNNELRCRAMRPRYGGASPVLGSRVKGFISSRVQSRSSNTWGATGSGGWWGCLGERRFGGRGALLARRPACQRSFALQRHWASARAAVNELPPSRKSSPNRQPCGSNCQLSRPGGNPRLASPCHPPHVEAVADEGKGS